LSYRIVSLNFNKKLNWLFYSYIVRYQNISYTTIEQPKVKTVYHPVMLSWISSFKDSILARLSADSAAVMILPTVVSPKCGDLDVY